MSVEKTLRLYRRSSAHLPGVDDAIPKRLVVLARLFGAKKLGLFVALDHLARRISHGVHRDDRGFGCERVAKQARGGQVDARGMSVIFDVV